ncbi:MAG: hypothetical protein VSS75_028945 [Candidatus Parabeggiatoa sp.]|nr:hypothetical protein [Candidatus Parabeggiatoa sp.]
MNFFWGLGLSLLLLLFSGCAENHQNMAIKPTPLATNKAEKLQNSSLAKQTQSQVGTDAKNVQNSVTKQIPSSVGTTKKVPSSAVKRTPASSDKITPTTSQRGLVFQAPAKIDNSILKRARDTEDEDMTDNNGGEQTSVSEQVPDCEGIPSNVSPRVLTFLTCKVVQIFSQPDRVESFLLIPKADTSVPRISRLGRFPIKVDGQGLNLEGINLEKFQQLVFSEDSYHFGMEKRCRFRPDVGLHFVKGDEAAEILFSLDCNLWLFVYEEEEKLEDFDPIQPELTFLNALFPIDMNMPETATEESDTPTETPTDVIDTPENSVET